MTNEPTPTTSTAPAAEPLLRYFAWKHLPIGPLRETSWRFQALADDVVARLPRSPERTVALRKLLEAKDAAVRAALDLVEAG